MSSPLRVAVTGGSGRIGHEVCMALVEHGHQVINLDRRQPPEHAGQYVCVDLTRREQVQPVLEKVDAICMLGDIPNAIKSIPSEQLFVTNVTIGSLILQTAAELKLKRVIFTSTCQVYGSWGWPVVAPAYWPIDETMPLRPQNCYAASKAANEMYARMLAEQSGLSVAAFRFPWVTSGSELTALPNARTTKFIDGFGTFLHVSDAARAYVQGLERQEIGFEAYHFSAPNTIFCKSLQEVAQEFPVPCPAVPPDWPGNRSPLNCHKAMSHLGWSPQWESLKFDACKE